MIEFLPDYILKCYCSASVAEQFDEINLETLELDRTLNRDAQVFKLFEDRIYNLLELLSLQCFCEIDVIR